MIQTLHMVRRYAPPCPSAKMQIILTSMAGKGVGRVTKPGLGLEIGKAAINPTPIKMLEQAVREVAGHQLENQGVDVVISVPNGEEIAKKTDNPRLGILGGISILGTTGLVLPYSTASFVASIRQGLDVATAMGADTVVLTTGGRSEDFAKVLFKLPDHCFIQMGDFAGYSMKQCANKITLRKVIIAGLYRKTDQNGHGHQTDSCCWLSCRYEVHGRACRLNVKLRRKS